MPCMPQMLRESHICGKTAGLAENRLRAHFATRKFPEDLAGVTPKPSAWLGESLGIPNGRGLLWAVDRKVV